ncbi:MAG: twin-arginine translocase subunit TatC [Desulfobulbaceae bacterium]|nr:twin-arginine translocase subunit TatC [Desulfobulbaceae bacterium]
MTEAAQKPNQLVAVILELRHSVRMLLSALVVGTFGIYFLTPAIMQLLQQHLGQKLAFFAVAEPFLAHVKLAFAVTLFVLMPGIVYSLWRGLAKPFDLTATSLAWFVFGTCVLFYSGASFCYFVTLPFGVDFLLGFQSDQLQPVISIGKFVVFVSVFILAFGFIFELPIFMVFIGKVGVMSRKTFERNRRYALLVISIVAALLTPTPDVVNMMLMGVPLYMLYELGIFILRLLRIP